MTCRWSLWQRSCWVLFLYLLFIALVPLSLICNNMPPKNTWRWTSGSVFPFQCPWSSRALVCPHGKDHTQGLRQQEFVPPQFWRPGVQIKALAELDPLWPGCSPGSRAGGVSGFWLAAALLWSLPPSAHSPPPSVSLSPNLTPIPPIGTPILGELSHPAPVWLFLTWSHLPRLHFQIRSYSQLLG